MGCGGSKVDDLPLVTLCRERKQLIRAAADHRYALSSAHLSYFHSLKDVGEALRRFVEEELVIPSTSSPSSPVLTLPSDEGKKIKDKGTNPHIHSHNHNHNYSHNHRHNHKAWKKKSTTSSGSISHIHSIDHDLPLSSDSDSDSDSDLSHLHLHHGDDNGGDGGKKTRAPPSSHQTRPTDWEGPYRMNPPPYQPDWNSYPMDSQPPPYQLGWGAYGLNPPYQTSWGPYVGNSEPYGFGNVRNSEPYGFGNVGNSEPYGYGNVGNSEPYGYGNVGNSGPYGYEGSFNTRAYYMKKSAPAVRTVIQDREQRMFQDGGQRMDYTNPSVYSGYTNEGGGGFFGFPMESPSRVVSERKEPSPAGPPPPPAPQGSGWDFLNPFDGYDHSYPGYYAESKYGYSSIASSPNSEEVREKEGIPDLEEETESEAFHREVGKRNKLNMKKNFGVGTESEAFHRGVGRRNKLNMKKNFGEGTSRAVPQNNTDTEPSNSSEESSNRGMRDGASDTTSKAASWQNYEEATRPNNEEATWQNNEEATWQNNEEATWQNNEEATWENREAAQPDNLDEEKSSPDTILSKGTEEVYERKKGVSFEIDETSMPDVDSSKLSSLTTLSVHGTRDLQEVVNEIRDEFKIASGYGKEVAMMLDAGKLPYQPKFAVVKVIVSRILYLVSPSSSSSRSLIRSMRLGSRVLKLARAYQLDAGSDENVKSQHLSSTLEKLYEWEKKLYQEVKDEERLRVSYEKMCKRLKVLDDRGAESSKIDATQASIRRLLTRLNVCIKAIDAISSRIQKLRDEELQPQVSELIHGLIRMWKSMLKCHQKQFQAIVDSKSRTLKANTGFGRDSSLRASRELEHGLESWCTHFKDWINAQKLYVESLHGWLIRCLHYEPEHTADGLVPFSPGRLAAPSIFIICNDWHQGMDSVSEKPVSNAMLSFASNLRQLWERQDEEQKQRIRAEYIIKDYENRRKAVRMEKGKMGKDQDAMSGKTGGSIVASDSGVSPLDDLKVDLDSLRHRMNEEKARHKDAIKLVNDAASTSLQGGIIPIFKALEKFTSEALKAHEQVRQS